MIRITDKTLSCLDEYDAKPEQLRELCGLLLEVGADCTELSAAAYEKIGSLPEKGKYVLKIDDIAQTRDYPEFDRFVCRHGGYTAPAEVTVEFQMNDVSEINFLRQYPNLQNIRIVGLDDVLCHDYKMAFGQIFKNVKGRVELCPENRYACATATAVEWILFGGKNAAASFAGAGGFAPLEEVLMALRLECRYKPNMDYSVFPKIRALYERITGEKIPAHKPVIGSNIFDVEAGIHVSAISKDPGIYEPFKPELVGGSRSLVLGKHSGRAAVALKMRELGFRVRREDVARILEEVKRQSIRQQHSLSDEEFVRLLRSMNNGGAA